MSIFAVIVTLRANEKMGVRSGALGWVCSGEWGGEIKEFDRASWNGACDRQNIPSNVRRFETEQAANEFSKKTKDATCLGCWWQKPTGKYEVVEIKQKFKQVPDGYEEVK